MRVLLVAVLIVAGAALADSPAITGHSGGVGSLEIGTDDLLDSYAYTAAEVHDNAYANFGAFITADDFEYVTDDEWADIEKVTYWGLSTASMPTSATMFIWDDTGGSGPGTQVWTGPATLTNTNSGYTFGAYIVYISENQLAATFFSAIPGTIYWIGNLRTDGNNLYHTMGLTVTGNESYLSQDTGATWVTWSSQGYPPTDMFRIIEGTPYVALDRDTWGSIKALF